jgi:hypothetical protein
MASWNLCLVKISICPQIKKTIRGLERLADDPRWFLLAGHADGPPVGPGQPRLLRGRCDVPHMQDNREDSAAKFPSGVKTDLDDSRSGEEIDFQAKYEGAALSVGAIPIFPGAFRRYEDSTSSAYLNVPTFLWKDLPASAWKEIHSRISESTQAVYQFMWFASRFLRIDVVSMIKNDPSVDDTAREFIGVEFPRGTPGCGNWEREVLEDTGVDPIALWRRVASEGAPMRVDSPDLG